MFKNKTLLITGGTGSFGNAVLNRFLGTEVKEIRVFSRDEKKQDDMRRQLNNSKLKFYIGNVRDYDSVFEATKGVDYIFHAAALKQVPSCEFFPMEAVRTNVIGTSNVIKAAVANKVKKVVVLSTDKAAYPINAMGISKAMMEKVAIAESRNVDEKETTICVTRYGNVMASRGSVIPLFIEQIEDGKPLTITDPDMTRFLMSLEESVDLVLFAYKNGRQGDLFVQKAASSTIRDLAQAMVNLFKAKNKIQIIGTRHGEKKYETLLTKEEMAFAEDLGDFFRVPADTRDLNYAKFFDKGEKQEKELTDYNSSNVELLDVKGVEKKLLTLDYIKSEIKRLKKAK